MVTERTPQRRRLPFWLRWPLRPLLRTLAVDHPVFAETPCMAGHFHLTGLCVTEGMWIHETTPCDLISTDELRRRLHAGVRVLWHGMRVSESGLLTSCVCGKGYLLQGASPKAPLGEPHLWPPTERVRERLTLLIEQSRTGEAELSRRLAEGGGIDPAGARLLREFRAGLQESREHDERLLAWIPTVPDLSNTLVMTTMSLEWDKERARARRRRRWLLLGGTLVGVCGWALGRSSVGSKNGNNANSFAN